MIVSTKQFLTDDKDTFKIKEITTNLHELLVTFVYKTTCTIQKDLLNIISSREKRSSFYTK